MGKKCKSNLPYQFEPQLFDNKAIEAEKINGEYDISKKLDGHRCFFIKGMMRTRQGKEVANKQIRERFEPLRAYTEQHDIIIDGEIYCHGMDFNTIGHYLRTEDLGNEKLPEEMKFYCFDVVIDGKFDMGAHERYEKTPHPFPYYEVVEQTKCKVVNGVCVNKDVTLMSMVDKALDEGYEGIMLKAVYSPYKMGRITNESKMGYKLKKFVTIDAKIKGIEQATEVDPNAEKKINELGRSVTSKKKKDRIPINKAAAFIVEYEGKDVYVTISETDEQKKYIWEHPDEFIGHYVEYKYTMTGMKDKPRFPNTVRMRYDKDEDDNV